jgi:hypothetical protein
VRQNRRLARAFGVLLQLAAGVGYLSGVGHIHAGYPMLNTVYLGTLMLTVSGLASGYWLFRNAEHEAHYERGSHAVFALWGIAWLLFGGLQEIDRFAGAVQLGAALAYVTVASTLLMLLSARLQWAFPSRVALYLPAAAMLSALLYAMEYAHPFAQWGGIGWLAVTAVHYWILRRFDAVEVDAEPCRWLHALACWVIALVIAWEANWRVELAAGGVWPRLPWGLIPALVLAWLSRQRLQPQWPLMKFVATYRIRAAIPLAVAIVAWIVLINLTSDGESSWLPYLPLLNPLDVSVALCGAALALWWTALTDEQRQVVWPIDLKGLLAAAAMLTFLWLNCALLRTLHHNWGAPLSLSGMAHSTLVQASLSVFWGVLGFAAMTVAANKHWRYVWIVGGVLMGIVVAKLFLVDLSSVGTLARITSFLTVGALLLVTGYLAPLPPRREAHAVERSTEDGA